MKTRGFWNIEGHGADRTALVDAATGREISYGELTAEVARCRDRLNAGPGVCRLLAAPSIDFVAMYLAALQAECAVILQDPKAPDRATPFPVLYTYDPATDALSCEDEGAGVSLHPDLRLLLSTSGSTGAKKYVRLSAENLSSNAEAIADYLHLTERDRAPTALPLSYSYGMSVLNSHLQVGASLVLTEAPTISETFWDQFAATACTSFAGVPQSFTLLERSGQLDRDCPSLRYVTQAGGKLAPDAVRRLAETGARRGWQVFVMYGQTEAAPRIAYLPPEDATRFPGAIGRAIPGGRLFVEDSEGRPITTPETEGELVYQGPNVMMGYATGEDDLSKGQGPNRLRTGDLGHQGKNGLFYITGRSARFLKLSGKRISLDEIDSWLSASGADAIAVGRDECLGLVHLGTSDDLGARVAKRLDLPLSLIHDVIVDRLPLNQNGKPDLPAALALLDQKLATKAPVETAGEDRVLALFQRQFPGARIREDASFQDLGGTSNDFMDMERALEEAGLDPPQNWHLLPISRLAGAEFARAGEARPGGPDYASARVICMVLVVLLHVVGLNERSGLELPASSIWHAINGWLDPLRMPMFAFLAGLSFRMMDNPATPPGRFAASVTSSILIPTGIAIVCFAIASTIFETQFALETARDVAELLLLPYAHYWFIMSLTLILGLSYVIFRFAPAPEPVFLAVALLALIIGHPGIRPNIWAINNAVLLLPFFALGVVYARFSATLWQHRKAIFAGAALAACPLIYLSIGDTYFDRVIYHLLAPLAIVLCLGIAGYIPGLRALGPYAFVIYLWHVFGTSGTRRALDAMGVELPVTLQVGLGLAGGILIPVLVYHLAGRLPGGRWVRGK